MFWYAFASHANGGRPVNRPAPPRICVPRSAPRPRLKPARGESMTVPLGNSLVSRPNELSTAGLWAGASGIRGTSMRTPSRTFNRSPIRASSWTKAENWFTENRAAPASSARGTWITYSLGVFASRSSAELK